HLRQDAAHACPRACRPAACPAGLNRRTLAATHKLCKRREPPVTKPRHSLALLSLALPVIAAAVAIAPAHAKDTGLIFVSNEKSNNIIVLDPKKNYQLVKDLKVSRRPRDMHFNSDRTKLYVACGDDDVIDIIDVAKLEVVGKLTT